MAGMDGAPAAVRPVTLALLHFGPASIGHLDEEHRHRVLVVRGKGDKIVLIPLPPTVARAIDRVRPVPGEQLPVPAEQGGRGDEERRPAGPGEQPGQGGQHHAVVRAQLWAVHLPPQDRDLMAQDQQLNVLRAIVPRECESTSAGSAGAAGTPARRS